MNEYVITTDNNSDLPEKYLTEHGVGCMYLSYAMDGKNYTHGNSSRNMNSMKQCETAPCRPPHR